MNSEAVLDGFSESTKRKIELPTLPSMKDPRVAVLGCLIAYVCIGISVLGFNRSFEQIGLMVLVAVMFEVSLSRLIHKKWVIPISAIITAVGLGILANAAHGLWLPLIPVIVSLASKYVITFNGKHVFNPSLFGLLASTIISQGMISPSPAYQWGGDGYLALIMFIVTLAVILFMTRIHRTTLILSFIGLYTLTLAIRAYYTHWHVPAETIILGTLASPAFYLFTFFMITDPATSPKSWKGQLFMAFFICGFDLWLHTLESLSTLFKAGFAYFTMVWLFRHGAALWQERASYFSRIPQAAPRLLLASTVTAASLVMLLPQQGIGYVKQLNFEFQPVDTKAAGITSEPSDILEHVDARAAHVAKWLLSVGDSVSFSDVNNDGLQDMFISYPLKSDADRAALYINNGNLEFSRFPLPELTQMFTNYKSFGLPSGSLWFDLDNDGDQDLLVLVSFGYSRLLINQLTETGTLQFVDRTEEWGLQDYTTTITANAIDINKDGLLDLIIGNASNPMLSGYEEPTPFNIFDLPEAEYEGDRRMLNFMHRSWGNANNGGPNYFYINRGDHFERLDNEALGTVATRWTLDIATGDLNQDGWTDIYMANDFGRDQMFLNINGERFLEVKGRLAGELGKDTYKGMNATIADLDGNGFLDVYVSNVHAPLQAEGSMLWLNSGDLENFNHDNFRDSASAKHILNENRFGWGAAAGDINLDGRLDLVQANGMVDDSYDDLYEGCPDYWYWNDRIALTGPDIHGYADSWADLRGRCIFPNQLNRVYINQGRYFVDVAEQLGMTKGGESRGMALVDLDNDGDLDLVTANQFDSLGIYRNEVVNKRWLGLALQGNAKTCNAGALGSVVRVYVGDADPMVREQQASNGFHAQGDQRMLFGLGNHAGPVRVEVKWCDGSVDTIQYSELNQYYNIQQAGRG